MEINAQDIDVLKIAIKKKYRQPIKTAKECKFLAEEITASVAGEQISQKTIQRLFQQNKTNFSPGILNILAKYVGYSDFSNAMKDLNFSGKYYSHSLAVGKHKLHDAMIFVLNQYGEDMTPEALADEINKQCLYEREDQKPLPADQILMRVEVRPEYFTYDEEKNLVSLRPAHKAPTPNN